MLSVAFLLKAAVALSFLAIPQGRLIDEYSDMISLALGCNSDGNLILQDLDSIQCDFRPSVSLNLTVEECGIICYDSDTQFMDSNQPYKRFRNSSFFRQNWNVNLICPASISGADCLLNRIDKHQSRDKLTFDQVHLINSSIHTFIIDKLIKSTKCSANYDRRLHFYKSNCRAQCLVHIPRPQICLNEEHVIEYNPKLTFWLYMFIRLLFGILLDGCTTLFDGACMAVVTRVQGDLGLQRIFGLLGSIFSPISGLMVDHFSVSEIHPNYT